MLDGDQKVICALVRTSLAQNTAGTGRSTSALGWTLPLTPPEKPRVLSKKLSRIYTPTIRCDSTSLQRILEAGQKLSYWVLSYWVRILTKEREQPPDVLLAHLTDESGKHLAALKIHSSADVRKAGKDGWIRESVDLSRFTLLP